MAKTARLKDVARAAGVSQMTVSRVVRGERSVKAATVARVQHFLHKLGYQPDPALSALAAYRAKGRARITGKILAFLETEKLPYNELVLSGARMEAAQLGYSVESFSLPISAKGQAQLGRQLFYRGIMGLLISPSNEPWRLEGWNWSRVAPVSLGALRHEPPMHAVAMDYFHGLQTAYQGLREMGFRRIGLFLREDLEARTGHLWLGSYLSIGKPALAPLLFSRTHFAEQALRQWRARHRPDAVLTIHADWHERLVQAGMVPAYLNNVSCPPEAPHIRLDAGYIGREGVQFVHRLLQKRELGLPELPKMILLRGEWNRGGPEIESEAPQSRAAKKAQDAMKLWARLMELGEGQA